MNNFDGIVVERQAALVFCNTVRQVWRTEYDPIDPKMALIPWKGIIVERVSAEEIL
jgi:hypothetical protein